MDIFRIRSKPKPKPFKILNHETKDEILNRLKPIADQQWKDHSTPLSKNIKDYSERTIWLYNRAMLSAAEVLPVFKYFDSIQPAMVPKDSMLVREWLHVQHASALKRKGARVDFSAPLEFDVCIIPDQLL